MSPILSRAGFSLGFGRRRNVGGGGPAFSATGGNQTPANGLAPGNGYKYHTFTSPGTFTVSSGGNVEVLIVGGGGGTGPNQYHPGGGGAGGLVHGTATLDPGPYPVSIGGGGTSGTPTVGGNTVFSTATAIGGGRAKHYDTPGTGGPTTDPYAAGGSGGGGGAGGGAAPNNTWAGPGTQAPQPLAGSTLTGYGNPGGIGYQTNNYGGGGGGAGEAGYPAAPPQRAKGGDGRQYPQFTGTLIGVPSLDPQNGYFAGGGGGSIFPNDPPSSGGLGGGGNGSYVNGSSGVNGTGGGAGGSERGGAGAPSVTGGSGIVIIRYLA